MRAHAPGIRRNPTTRRPHRKNRRNVDMLSLLVSLALIVALVAGPLVWRLRADRRHSQAELLGAVVRSAVNRRLRGESLLSVEVHARTLLRPGRVVLSTPHGYEWLAEEAWRSEEHTSELQSQSKLPCPLLL